MREERPHVLEEKMRDARLLTDGRQDSEKGDEYQWYLDLRKFGGAPLSEIPDFDGNGLHRVITPVTCNGSGV